MDEDYIMKIVQVINDEIDIYKLIITLFDVTIKENFDDPFNKDWDELKKLLDNKINIDRSIVMLKKLLMLILNKNNQMTVLIENNYIDKYYRSSYYIYFAGKYANYSRYCKRLIIFSGNYADCLDNLSIDKDSSDFIGSIVLRPIIGYRIGRTLLNPKFIYDQEMHIRGAKYNITVFGMRLCLDAFPFSMQDGETTSCAEITILNLVDYFCTRYPEYRLLLPENINDILSVNSNMRVIPTTGLSYNDISKLLMNAGFQPIIYHRENTTDMTLKKVLSYYIESGIPIGIGIEVEKKQHHSVVCIGHGKIDTNLIETRMYRYGNSKEGSIWVCDMADFINEYIVMDDEQIPYSTFTYDENFNIKSEREDMPIMKPEVLIIPLYKRMILDAKTAYDLCMIFLSNKDNFSAKYYMTSLKQYGTLANPIVTRLFLASSRSFKYSMIQRLSDMIKAGDYDDNIKQEMKNIRTIYSELMLPKFIWVCELYTKNSQSVIGQILIDATTTTKSSSSSIIMAHYQDIILIKKHDNTNVFDDYDMFYSYNLNSHRNI